MSFFLKTSGTWINIATVLFGTMVGVLLQHRLPEKMRRIITQGVGLLTLWLGVSMAGSLSESQGGAVDGAILGLGAITLGGIIGEWAQLEDRLTQLGDGLKHRFRGKGQFTEGFMASSLLFCIGPLAFLGSLNNGLTGDNTLLVLKASMDGFAAIALTSSYGIGVGFSTLSILLYQGGLSLTAGVFATLIPNPETDPRLALITGVGGLMIIGLGLNLLDVAKIRVASFLPAILLAPFLYHLAIWLSG
ncbi:DUF554 domain-containing protein [Spirulina sp. CS-785/01]|uniref:DUF554 domain-containing protein n=1 Tax=Spirulina sp. CS-785/01 TaxID=3021716 RepID=UPI00232C033B|nr:DUF554 domain-containing protein [Spirulina sp. CS-785/01]MDB9313337.1 DUF554 domain-containing protein [Spirulina sp. CS-785/01]